MRWFKIIFLALLICFVIIQFFQPGRSKIVSDRELAFSKIYEVPENVQQLMQNACYDCHSNETKYPWYTYVQPAGWLLNKHIHNGREQLNLSEFGNISSRKRISKIKEMLNEVKDDAMPMYSYTIIHKDARLKPAEKELLVSWLGHLSDSLLVN